MPYQPDSAFAGLFSAFTGGAPDSIGAQLTQQMVERSAGDPLLVSTASDIALFPGAGAAPRIESFRKSTRGFIELTAVSHVPLALAYLARMRELGLDDDTCRGRIGTLLEHAQRVRAANTEQMWKDHVALRAFEGQERKITRMVEYTLSLSADYLQRASADLSLLDFATLRARYLDPDPAHAPVTMNEIMFATFCLAFIDIAYRIGNWLRVSGIDWSNAMVLVSGQSGRPTAGVSWSSNNMCHLIHSASEGALLPERLYVAPHAPGFSVAQLPDAQGLARLEANYRRLWCHTRASVEVSRAAFDGYPAFRFVPESGTDMPPIGSLDNRAALVARLRRIMEDPQQLLSNCVATYVVDALRESGNRPELVPVPGFTNATFS
jgi:hypothetical protein